MKIKILFIYLFLLSFAIAHAQNVTVSGTIVDNLNEPLIGVSVAVKGTTTGVSSDLDGKYSIQAPENSRLVFSFVGMHAQELTVPKGGGTLNVTLLYNDQILGEVIVTGYGTYKKSAYAGSASTVKTENLEDIPAVDFTTMLQGNAPGVSITSLSGQPGGSTSVRIRGMGSINASNSPLYVIDGIPVISGNVSSSTSNNAGLDMMSTINPSDIENITVIKDASAASLYGSRAANGVILVTTKSGKAGKPVFNLKADFGFSRQATDYREVMNGPQRREMLMEGLRNQAVYIKNMTDQTEIDAYVQDNIDTYAPIPWSGWADWKKELFRENAPFQNIDFSASGGDKKLSYYMSLAHTKQEGLSYQSGFNRLSGRLNVKYQMTDRLELGANILYSHISQDVNSEGGAYASPIYTSRHKITASEPVYNEDGTFFTDFFSNGPRNPVEAMKYNTRTEKIDRSFNTVFANYKFMDGLVFNTTFSYDHSNNNYRSWSDPRTNDGGKDNGILSIYRRQRDQIVWKNNLTYVKTFAEKHNLDILGGYEVNQYKSDYLFGEKTNFPSTDKVYPSNGAEPKNVAGYLSSWRLLSYLSRANYNFNEKYFFGASVRVDGTSRLSPSQRWGTFWSVSGAWRVSEEAFMKSLDPVLSDVKLRASYGTNGTPPSNDYYYLDLTKFTYPYNKAPGIAEEQIGNKNLKWEKQENLNIGVDFRLFERIGVSFEWYNRQSSDLINPSPISYTTGFKEFMDNVGVLRNRGVELDISADILRTKDFTWNSHLNFGYNKNEIVELATGEKELRDGSFIRRVGKPWYSYHVVEFAGINPDTGVPQFYVNDPESDNPKEITENYKEANRILYKQATPKLTGGWTNSLKYKIVDLNFTWTFTLGGYSYDSGAQKTETAGSNGYDNIPQYYSKRWQKPGDKTSIEKYMVGNQYDMSKNITSRRIHSTDHFRLKNITLGLTIPKNIVNRVKLNNVRLYMSAVNLLTFAKYDNYDPEVPINGVVYFESPKLKTITFGIDIKF
ncbi:SusC/RagA family TonB-linked outer membrane protein [Dysgonomonas massiliensis]|uniref:SusC/RagA family TonB-linked outer membrane protein n=1 Tax=Dysgonomonas massiliensis TaxID=2040292 RepID=UPI000C77185A|nr:TonB-dependent receptor [Dysgonomonas massiliensis]